MNKKDLIILFKEYRGEFTSQYPHLVCEIGDESYGPFISFPPVDDSGFEVFAFVDENQIIVSAGNVAHCHFDGTNIKEEVANAFGFIYDLLSPCIRVHENWVGKTPYSGCFEVKENDNWSLLNYTRLLVWTLFRKKKKLVLQNNQLPIRDVRE